ncbi:MAG: nucleotidyltransferase substrate binding protein [Bacteroidales bacterium]|nr:nucleotidyltransferase substrate binding protein [Bacteroidales bacterium]MCM1146589.1 nucleotidyltransferase substrate binding protein [Bacteroidales bacterium]MCM1205981.1 nucleotidyltransferase substrate binding protein [Bacillota bacterium]MCM1510138.1 nucleotidyltransferase substrate binding protein [Clostridium sp.]
MDTDIRWKQRFQNFERAVSRLREGVTMLRKEPANFLMQAGLIQTFEFTFELAWKVLKDFLESEGFVVQSPKSVIRQAFQSGYIDDAEEWLHALSARNLTVHTYDDDTAEVIIRTIESSYLPMLERMYNDFAKRL